MGPGQGRRRCTEEEAGLGAAHAGARVFPAEKGDEFRDIRRNRVPCVVKRAFLHGAVCCSLRRRTRRYGPAANGNIFEVRVGVYGVELCSRTSVATIGRSYLVDADTLCLCLCSVLYIDFFEH